MEELHEIVHGNCIPLDMSTWSLEAQDAYMNYVASSMKYTVPEIFPGLHPDLVIKYIATGFLIDIK